MSASTLDSDVAKSLPKGVELSIRHLTHPPVPCDAILSPPPGEQAEQTHFQSHFLVASIKHGDGQEVLVFAIEVVVYTTSRLTTVFVSKADSTGYLHLLNLPPGTSSLIRSLSTAFLSFLVDSHQRDGVRLVLSLFARSQSQYLFPGSSENVHKHILDDRGLVKWWCRVFDPILRSFVSEVQQGGGDGPGTQYPAGNPEQKDRNGRENVSATAYLVVPGCEKLETRTFFPATFRSDDQLSPRWVNAYPVKQISSRPTAPPRCLVPRFPDDPKARLLIDLDDEVTPESETGRWRSVNTLDQFWEMMAFRQECSAGRLVGFLWMVVNPPGMANSDGVDGGTCTTSPLQKRKLTDSQSSSTVNDGRSERHLTSSTTVDAPPTGSKSTQAGEVDQDPSATAAYPTETFSQQLAGRGVDDKTVILSHADYHSVTDFLTKLDFADKDIATASTESWLGKLSSISRHESGPGEAVVGQGQSPDGNSYSQRPPTKSQSDANVLDTSLIRKRKRENTAQRSAAESGPEVGREGMPDDSEEGFSAQNAPAAATVLQPQLIRKRRKDG